MIEVYEFIANPKVAPSFSAIPSFPNGICHLEADCFLACDRRGFRMAYPDDVIE